MILDGILPTGYIVDRKHPFSSVEFALAHQDEQTQIKAKRKYRKIKKFIIKKYNLQKNINKINMANYVKYHYLDRARKISKK